MLDLRPSLPLMARMVHCVLTVMHNLKRLCRLIINMIQPSPDRTCSMFLLLPFTGVPDLFPQWASLLKALLLSLCRSINVQRACRSELSAFGAGDGENVYT